MVRQLVHRLAGRPAAFAGLAIGLSSPVVLGAMLVHVGGFYPDTALATALRTSGLLLASTPAVVLVLEARRSHRERVGVPNTGNNARREWK